VTTTTLDFNEIGAAFDVAVEALEKLDVGCCEPGRSPRIAALSVAFSKARHEVKSLSEDTANKVLSDLEDIGAQIGALQVGCCAPARMPLYSTMLEQLVNVQRTINRSLDRGH
jgi:hypothetical protein